jgi:hypothetical protein
VQHETVHTHLQKCCGMNILVLVYLYAYVHACMSYNVCVYIACLNFNIQHDVGMPCAHSIYAFCFVCLHVQQ